MKNLKKTISIALVIAVLIAGVLGTVACQNDSLDGKYKDTKSEKYIVVNGNTIKLYFKDDFKKEGTFTRKDDKLITTMEAYEDITVSDNGDLIVHGKTVGGDDIDLTFKKIKE